MMFGNALERIWKESLCLIEALLRHLEGLKRNIKPLTVSRCPCWVSNRAFSEYKSEALPLDLTCSVPVDFSQPQRKMSPVAIGCEMRWTHSSDVWWRRGSPTSGARPSLYWLRYITSRHLLSLFYVVWRQA